MEIYKNIVFDSKEEKWFAQWCNELKEAGYVADWDKENIPMSIIDPVYLDYIKTTELKTKSKREVKRFTLLKDFQYTPDFWIMFTQKGYDVFVSPLNENVKPDRWFFGKDISNPIWVEVKPIFDQHGKTARFSIVQKLIWHIKKIFVDLIIVEDLFKGTFMPREAMDDFKYKKSPTGKNKGKKGVGDWKCNYIPKTLNEFLNGH